MSFNPLVTRGYCGLVDKVMDWRWACHEVEPCSTEDPFGKGGRCMLNMSRLKILPLVWRGSYDRRMPSELSSSLLE
ncbi:hypothetical protein TNCV_3672941 [Trichonephila clavipes]|nr:hypothetical protein TNCV_3672941 [Trichonephila clavipes]